MQIEGLVFLAFWGGLLWLGPWHWQTIAVAYAAFAFTWSSLQWVYHLHTPVHVVEGAYNLRAPWLVRVLFLNFNYNLTHHRRPAAAVAGAVHRKQSAGDATALVPIRA